MAGRLGKSIDIGNIGKYFDRQVVRKVVAATTLEWQKRVINETPVDTGRLRNDWRVNIKPFVGEITNRVEYADASFTESICRPLGSTLRRLAGGP